MDRKGISPLRWFALIAIICNIIFNYVYDNILDLKSAAEVTQMYDSLFTPAGYAFAIWGLIYTAFLIYGVIQLLPSNRNIHLYDRLAIPVILVNTLASAWLYLFAVDLIDISMGVISLMLFLSWIMFKFAREAALGNVLSGWIKFPFSMLFGWLTVAVTANLSIWLVSNGVSPAGNNILIIICYILAALIVSLFVTYKYCDHIYPLVIAWAMTAIWVKQMDANPIIAYTALAAAVITQIWSVFVWKKRER